jgi:hypothetical protein
VGLSDQICSRVLNEADLCGAEGREYQVLSAHDAYASVRTTMRDNLGFLLLIAILLLMSIPLVEGRSGQTWGAREFGESG